ncbi:MAG: transglycosylase SLT domain-containing protein [Burkholderiales bacterium]|nr:transglycosylase SLT domain-containing protein [Burkholderiales bacterium]
MPKKLILLLCINAINIYCNADEISNNFMLMNNYNVRQTQDIWQRMRQGFRLQSVDNQRVHYYEKMYTKNQVTFNKLIKNAYPYLYFVLTQTERYGFPSELALVPIVESNYDSCVINGTGRYDGIWQFIPSTGASFNLNEDGNINDRRNIVKATNAAMLYFNSLNMIFKQWDVAIGAYNWGAGNMYKAILSSNQKLGLVDYSTLPLRDITANYVPKIIALANIIKYPSKFGVKLIDIPNQPYFAITHPVEDITVANIITTSQTDKQSFKILNPQFKNTSYGLKQQQAQILLPIQNQNIYLASASGISIVNSNNIPPNNNVVAVTYTNNEQNHNYDDAINKIGYADSGLNNAVNVSYSNVPVTSNRQTVLIVPKQIEEKTTPTTYATNTNKKAINDLVASIGDDDNETSSTINKKFRQYSNIHYRVNKGDTLYSISKKFDINVNKIRKINKLHGNKVKSGQVLMVVKTEPHQKYA